MSTVKVFWKDHERESVALRFAEITQAAELNDEYMPYIGALERAQQEVLSEDRWRPRNSLQNTTSKERDLMRSTGLKLLKAKKEAQADADKQHARYTQEQEQRERSMKGQPKLNGVSTQVIKPGHAIEHLEVHDVQDVTVNNEPRREVIGQYRYDEMISAAVDSIGEAFRLALTTKLNAVVNETMEGIHDQISSRLVDIEQHSIQGVSDILSNAKKKKIVLCGIKIDQFREIEKDYGQYFNLHFIDSKAPKRLKAAIQGAQNVILNSDSISHVISETARRHPGLKMSNGGSSGMKDVLLELATDI
jgi:hypothetical protein